MKVYSEISLRDFKPWSGAVPLWKEIIDKNKVELFDSIIEDCYSDGISDVELNDLLWFEQDWIREFLDMPDDEE